MQIKMVISRFLTVQLAQSLDSASNSLWSLLQMPTLVAKFLLIYLIFHLKSHFYIMHVSSLGLTKVFLNRLLLISQ